MAADIWVIGGAATAVLSAACLLALLLPTGVKRQVLLQEALRDGDHIYAEARRRQAGAAPRPYRRQRPPLLAYPIAGMCIGSVAIIIPQLDRSLPEVSFQWAPGKVEYSESTDSGYHTKELGQTAGLRNPENSKLSVEFYVEEVIFELPCEATPTAFAVLLTVKTVTQGAASADGGVLDLSSGVFGVSSESGDYVDEVQRLRCGDEDVHLPDEVGQGRSERGWIVLDAGIEAAQLWQSVAPDSGHGWVWRLR